MPAFMPEAQKALDYSFGILEKRDGPNIIVAYGTCTRLLMPAGVRV
jgi:hypothetical protein